MKFNPSGRLSSRGRVGHPSCRPSTPACASKKQLPCSKQLHGLLFELGYTNLQPHCMLVFSLHVIDVPGHPLHGVDRLLDHVIHLWILLQMSGDLLQDTSTPQTSDQCYDHLYVCVFMYRWTKKVILCVCVCVCILTCSSRWYFRILWTGLSR